VMLSILLHDYPKYIMKFIYKIFASNTTKMLTDFPRWLIFNNIKFQVFVTNDDIIKLPFIDSPRVIKFKNKVHIAYPNTVPIVNFPFWLWLSYSDNVENLKETTVCEMLFLDNQLSENNNH